MTSTVKIPEWWIETTLGQLVKVWRWSSPRPIQDYVQNFPWIPWVKIADATSSNSRFITETWEFIKEEWRSTTVYPWDLIVSNSATPWIPKFMQIEACVHDWRLVFSDYKNIEKDYLYYFFLNYRRILEHQATWTVFKNLKTDIVRNLEIIIPQNPQEQKAIAGVLSVFDDKIELLRAENQTLEEMGQTLFKEWFGKYKVGDELPDGWKEYELSELVDTINWYSYKGNELVEKSSEALVTLKSFDRNWWFQTRWFKEFKWNPKSEQEVFVWDLVVAHTDLTQDAEVLGNPAFIVNNWWFERLYITMDLVKVNSKNENITKSFLYFLMRTKEFKWHCVWYSNWTTVLHLSKKAIPEYKIVLPKDLSWLKEKSLAFELIMKKISHNFSQIDELIKTRDQLLPKLMSWKVRVKF